MKLKDLFENPKIIKGDVNVPSATTELDYEGVIVNGNFICFDTSINSLQGAPAHVGGYFNCSFTSINSLQGAPAHVGGYFNCSFTSINSLQGAPAHVGGYFDCSGTNINSLHDIHKQIKYIGGMFLTTKVESHILGLMLIKGLKGININTNNKEQVQAMAIINKHLAGNRNVHDVHEELLEAGLEEFAQL